MQKFAHKPVMQHLKDHDDVNVRVRASVELQFVYDFADMDTPFEKLNYINDAGRTPMQPLPDNSFLARYGLERKLSFRPAEPRARVPQDWWSVYG